MCLGKGVQAHLRYSEYRVIRLDRERARVDGGVRKATARARPRACASAVRGQRVLRGERWRSLARATRARAARRSGERPGARRVLAASGRLTSFLRRDSPKIYRRIEHTVALNLCHPKSRVSLQIHKMSHLQRILLQTSVQMVVLTSTHLPLRSMRMLALVHALSLPSAPARYPFRSPPCRSHLARTHPLCVSCQQCYELITWGRP